MPGEDDSCQPLEVEPSPGIASFLRLERKLHYPRAPACLRAPLGQHWPPFSLGRQSRSAGGPTGLERCPRQTVQMAWWGLGIAGRGAWRVRDMAWQGHGRVWRGVARQGLLWAVVWHGEGVASTWLHGRGGGVAGQGMAWRGCGMVRPAHLLLELHADGVGLLEEDGVAPQQVPQ